MITLSELLDGAGYDIDHVKGALKHGFEDALGIEARRSVLTGEEIELVQRLSEKHRTGTGSTEWMIRGGGGWSGNVRNGWDVGEGHVL